TKCGLISIASSRASGSIAPSSARVVPPVPGPSSTISLALCARVARVTRRSRKRELGMIDPTCLGRRRKPRKNAKRSSGWSRRGRFCSGTGGPPGKRPHPGREVAHFIADILLQLIVDPIDLPFAADVVEAQPNHHTVLALNVELVESKALLGRPPAARGAPGPRAAHPASVPDRAADPRGARPALAHLGGDRRPQRAQCQRARERRLPLGSTA